MSSRARAQRIPGGAGARRSRRRARERPRLPAGARRRRARAAREVHGAERALHDPCDADEGQTPLEERLHRHLVRCIERAGRDPSPLPRLARQREQRERLEIRLLEGERQSGERERRHGRRGALGVGEGVGDRHAHVRVAEMREHRTVAEADERVHDRPRVHDHLDLLVREPEEVVRLDELEPLVREGGRVDGDLRAHRPGRVRERVLHGDVAELVAAAAAKRAARGGQDEGVRRTPESRPSRHWNAARVLAVDGQQAAAAPTARGEREVAGRDEALLVGEREVDAVLERPQRRREPGEADDGVQHHVRLGALEQRDRVAADLRVRHAVLGRERVERRRRRT